MIRTYFASYLNSMELFTKFHNEVMNLPRDEFSNAGLKKIKQLAGYLLLTNGYVDDSGNNFKEIMKIISNRLVLLSDNGMEWRNTDIENDYFVFDNIDSHYTQQGRMFRHLMELCELFGLINSITRQKKTINYRKCKEYFLSPIDLLKPIARNNLLAMNINSNDFIRNLKGITIKNNADYRPAYSILYYMKKIDRPVTKFEISVLLGRVDSVQIEDDIIDRALMIGRTLPNGQQEQENYFFREMGWEENGVRFQYASSQQPYFKFNTFLLYLKDFGLIKSDDIQETFSLTSYAKELLEDEKMLLVKDLEGLISEIQEKTDNKQLNDLILYNRNSELLEVVVHHSEFIKALNYRSLKYPQYNQNHKRIRNRLIAEFAKIQANYVCQYTLRKPFQTSDGSYYCEAHHIIEFNREDGPDITNNLVVLGPDPHMRIHHGSKQVVNDTFTTLVRNNAIKLVQFEEMITVYHCLKQSHIVALYNKGAITENEKYSLMQLLDNDMRNNPACYSSEGLDYVYS